MTDEDRKRYQELVDLKRGHRVRTAAQLNHRDFVEAAIPSRRTNAEGVCGKHSDGHGLCFEIFHSDTKKTAWYNLEELTDLTSPAQHDELCRLLDLRKNQWERLDADPFT